MKLNYTVYLIITVRNNRLISYVGYTSNLKKRLKSHNNNQGAKFTRGNKWKLLYKENYKSKNEAMSAEYKLKKNYKLRKKIKDQYIKNENSYIASF